MRLQVVEGKSQLSFTIKFSQIITNPRKPQIQAVFGVLSFRLFIQALHCGNNRYVTRKTVHKSP